MLIRRHSAGMTLVEVLIALAIAALLMVMGAPSFTLWMQNTQVRNAAESIQNGLQIARAEAVRRNVPVRFNLNDAAGGVAWSVDCVTVTADCPAAIQSRGNGEGSRNARAGISTDALPAPLPANHFNTPLAAGAGMPAGVTFNGIGRVPTANAGTDLTRIDITNAVTANARRMVIIVGSGGQTRMCDPALALATTPQGCS